MKRPKQEERLQRELQFHIEQHTEELIRRGHDPEEARRLANLEIGGLDQVKEECRDVRPGRWVEDLWQDFRYALRTLGRRPGFAAAALLTLAFGAGSTTLMFTVVDGVLLRPLPYNDPARLVRVHGYTTNWNVGLFGQQNLSYPDFVDCRASTASLSMAGTLRDNATIRSPGDAEHIATEAVSSNMFSLLGVPLSQGRAFLPEEDRSGGAAVAIIGYDLWQRKFGGHGTALGAELILDDKSYTVVGVTPPNFRIDGYEADVFTPLGQNTLPVLQRRGPHPIGVIARLRPGTSLDLARAELDSIGKHLAAQYSDTNKGRTFIAEPLRLQVGDAGATLWLLSGAVVLVLLIACANVASLLLARAVSRTGELAMRVALGARRGRLVRQCLTESTVLGIAGGLLGVGIAFAGLKPFVALWPGSLPRAEAIQVNWRVFLFAIAVSIASGILFGIAPALRGPGRRLEGVVRSGRQMRAGGTRRLHSAFVISQIALALVLLVSAGMLGRTLLRLSSLDPGVNLHNVLTARVALSPATLADADRTRAAWAQLLEHAGHTPGVRAIAMVDTVPMRSGSNPIAYRTAAAAIPENRQPLVLANSVSPDYLKVTDIPLRRGRFLTEQDRLGAQSVAVIDEVMAQQAFAGEDPVGKRIWLDAMGPDPITVVGVVGHVRYWGLAGDDLAEVRAQLYYPFAQVPDNLVRRWSELMSIAVRTDVEPLSLLPVLRHELRGDTGDQVLYVPRTLEQLAGESLAQQRFLLALFAFFAGMALLLACVGIYGVLSYLTNQRVPEMGVRLALGAKAGDVVWLVLRQSLGMILAGTAIGGVGAFAAHRVLLRVVQGMQPGGFATSAGTIAILAFAALLASYLPARRASHIDPMKALREN